MSLNWWLTWELYIERVIHNQIQCESKKHVFHISHFCLIASKKKIFFSIFFVFFSSFFAYPYYFYRHHHHHHYHRLLMGFTNLYLPSLLYIIDNFFFFSSLWIKMKSKKKKKNKIILISLIYPKTHFHRHYIFILYISFYIVSLPVAAASIIPRVGFEPRLPLHTSSSSSPFSTYHFALSILSSSTVWRTPRGIYPPSV